MPKQSSYLARIILAVALTILAVPAVSVASTYKTLHEFTGPDGAAPLVGLISDASGNLYGTARSGGKDNCGVVFKLTPNSSGNWTETVLHSFVESTTDGCSPVASLLFDAAGNLYGTAGIGGGVGCGVAFELSPGTHGAWDETILYSFGTTGFGDGCIPEGNLVFDASGNLYGTTQTAVGAAEGGPQGSVFKLTRNADGTWTESVLFAFNDRTGISPLAGLVFDHAGNLYGTASELGETNDRDYGVAFKMSSSADGSWTEDILHQFTNNTTTDGNYPASNLVFDTHGNLYGTTTAGGSGQSGVVFELTPNGNGTWTETILHAFQGTDGNYPYAGLIFDPAGNLYGTTELGGTGQGVVFKMTPGTSGTWDLTVLYDFAGTRAMHPIANLLRDKAGNLYGTTRDCAKGTGCFGVVFEITP